MAVRLLLLRHAEAEALGASGEDAERALSDEGRRQAKSLGRFLAGMTPPHRALTSPARRARETLAAMTAGAGWSLAAAISPALWEASPADLLGIAREQREEVASLLLVGHEPAFSATVSALAGGGQVKMATGALACLRLESWAAAAPGAATLLWLLTPELLGER